MNVRIMLKTQRLWIVVLSVSLVISVSFISPKDRKARSEFHSSQLRMITTKDEDIERTDYVNADGQLTIAANLGYATCIVTTTGKNRTEQYFDDKGEPISRYNGYYALLREYDDNGNNIRTTYLDRDGAPMIMANGYAIEEVAYNEHRQAVAVRYYDTDGLPVSTRLYGYGKINEYDENGRICRITYTDAAGAPTMTGQGYAIVRRMLCMEESPYKGKVESEFYFDEQGNPVCLSLGQYGVHKEYDEYGRDAVLTYLDAEGNPAASNKGYTTVVRSYQPNGAVAKEQYYDANGDPYRMEEGQYGFVREGGRTVYLDAEGNPMFNLRNQLYNRSWLVVVFALVAVLLSTNLGRRGNAALLVLYIGAIAYFTLMFRENGAARLQLEPFHAYSALFRDSEARADILKNIWLFIPLGAILYRLYPRKIMLIAPVLLSVIIELAQYATGTGLCEMDDVISNSLGATIGYGLGALLQTTVVRIKKVGKK